MTDPARWLRARHDLAGPWPKRSTALQLGNGWLLILQAWLLARIIELASFHQAGLADVRGLLFTLLGLYPLRALLAWGGDLAAHRGAAEAKSRLRMDLARHLFALGPLRLGGQSSGGLAPALVDGIEAMEPYFARFLPAMAFTALLPLSILLLVLPLDWISGLTLLLTAPLIPFFMILVGKGAERLNQRQWRRLARLSARALEALQGLATLKLLGAARAESEVLRRLSEDYRRATLEVLRVAFLSSLALEFFATVSIALVAVGIGFRLLWGQMAFLDGLFILLLAPEFYLPLRTLGGHYHARMEAIGAAERLLEVFALSPPAPPAAPAPVPDLRASPLRLQGVYFAYAPGRPALAGLDLEIQPRQRLALIGPSGAGKSTLFHLLLGFAGPDAGRILVADTPLPALDPAAWRRHTAWLPQNPRLFAGSLRENLCLGLERPSAPAGSEPIDDGALWRALDQAQARDFVAALPGGLDSRVGERGSGLSGGQIQRLALARAFLRDAPLVLLDEPTASLDPDNETRVQAAIDALARGRTLVVIAHRLDTLEHADRILLMDQGRIRAAGDHQALMADPLYRHLLEAFGK